MKIVKHKIELEMARKGLTYSALAKACGYKFPGELGRVLAAGKARPVTVAKIAKGLGVDVTIITETVV